MGLGSQPNGFSTLALDVKTVIGCVCSTMGRHVLAWDPNHRRSTSIQVGRALSLLPWVVRATLETREINICELCVDGGWESVLESNAIEGNTMCSGLVVVVSVYKQSGVPASMQRSVFSPSHGPATRTSLALSAPEIPRIRSDSCAIVTESMTCTLDALFHFQWSRELLWRPTGKQALEWSLDLIRAVNYIAVHTPE